EVMRYALSKYPQEFFSAPPPIPADVPPALRGVYSGPSGVHNILHWVNKDNPRGGGNSIGDGQYPYWEYSLGGWFEGTLSTTTASTTPESDEDEDEDDDRRGDRDED